MGADREELLQQWRHTAREKLRRCGELRTRRDHEGFLASARKLVEALCKCLLLDHLEEILQKTRGRAKDGKRAADQLQAKILVPEELGLELEAAIDTLSTCRVIRRRVMATLHSVSLYGHEGSHARSGDDDAYAVVADQCAVGLLGLPRDLLLQALYGADATDSLDLALSALRSDAEIRADELSVENVRLRRQLDDREAPPPRSPATSSVKQQSEAPRLAFVGLVLFAFAGIGGGFGAGYWIGSQAEAPVRAAAIDPVGSDLPTEEPLALPAPDETPNGVAEDDDASVDDGGVTSSPTTTSLRCPDGTRRFEGGTLELGQPSDRATHNHRTSWPDPRPRELAPVHVDPFCMDVREVTRAEVRFWNTIDGVVGCDPLAAPLDLPARCLTHQEAAAYCESRGRSLPTIAQWEHVARNGHGVRAAPATSEWVEDRFPPALFNRRHGCRSNDPGCGDRMRRDELLDTWGEHPRWSWNRPSADPAVVRLADLSFRCVSMPIERSGDSSPAER